MASCLALLVAAGCQHLRDNEREFFTGAEQGIPAAREYAAGHLKNLSGPELRTITGTAPAISHADFARVHYRWTNLCTVLASPPPCEPYMVIDHRRGR